MARAMAGVAVMLACLVPLACGSPKDAGSKPDDGACAANGDGVITELELNSVAGASAAFLRATGVTVDTAGTVEGGIRVWDFSGPYPGDESYVSTLEPVADKWFADDFPDASYVWWLDWTELYGVYQADGGKVVLLGYASSSSASDSASVTHYDPPLLMFRTPFNEGDSWQTSSSLTGTSPFGPIDYTDTYAVSVDGRGEMVSPGGSVAVLRVNGLATRDDGVDVEAHRQQYYLAECRGIVGAVLSETLLGDEPPADFTAAEEIARIAE